MKTWEEETSCEIHGSYIGKYYSINGDKVFGGTCQECLKIKEKAEQDAKDKEEQGKARARKTRKRENAGISKRNLHKTFDDYICKTEGQAKAKADVIKFKESFPCENSLLFIGGVGTGKTLLASALLDSLIDDYSCGIVKLIDIIRSLKETWRKGADESEAQVLAKYINADLLIIDEVGAQFGSDTEKLFLFEIIDGRYEEMKPTILISNLDIKGVTESVGERCIDRLREGGGSMIAFDWSSERK